MTNSHVLGFLQTLSDSIGSRLTGSPSIENAQTWLIDRYRLLGIPGRREQYGTWNSWRRGATHLELISPRVRSLEAMMLSWSPGTSGRWVEAGVIALPPVTTEAEFDKWLPAVKGKFVLMSVPQPSCRPATQYTDFGTQRERDALKAEQDSARASWLARTRAGGDSIWVKLAGAGALGGISSNWSGLPGVDKIFGTPRQRIPAVDVTCEDYGLVYRLSSNNQSPRLRLFAEAEFLGERPAFNVIAEMKGAQKPNEYVVLSAHFDSWEGSSGATDNGTGTVTMLEAMRILRAAYPHPKRTILVGHWSGEEEGLNGSRAFSEDHPEVVSGLQALFNQDNGTGRVVFMGPGALPGTGAVLQRYLSAVPSEITQWIRFGAPSGPASGGSDNASFACYGAPSFNLNSLGWDYGPTTWHTNRDTFDKVVPEDLVSNATLVAMLAYLASEDPAPMPRDRLNPLPPDPRTGNATTWPACTKSLRKSSEYKR